MNCVFCEQVIGSEREIARNELACAFPTNMPIVAGHVLVVPLRCEAKFENLTEKEKLAIWELTEKMIGVLKRIFGAEGYHYALNEGRNAGQSVPHFHLHILPRTIGDSGIYEYEPRKFLYRPGERATIPDEELAEISSLIREAL